MSESQARRERVVLARETGEGPFGTMVAIGAREIVADEPVANGGLGRGPDPFELVMAGLAACTSMTLRLYADRKGWALRDVEVQIQHVARLTEGAPRDVFERRIRLNGELSRDQHEQLLAVADRCPVSRTLSTGVMIVTRATQGLEV